jgi:hypothetical protein
LEVHRLPNQVVKDSPFIQKMQGAYF